MKCFDHHKKNNKQCNKKSCRYWIDFSSHQNCCIVASSTSENFTLQEIGEIFKVTRMRICQIEKIAIQKLKEKVNKIIQS